MDDAARWPDRLLRALRAPLAAAAAALALGCAVNPVTGRHDVVLLTEAQEIALGRRAHQQLIREQPLYGSRELRALLEEVGQRLARASHRPALSYTFTLIDSPEINAFALPGGYVYLTRGILAYLNSEAELAAVVGHELGHVTARHAVQRISQAHAVNFGMTLGMVLVPELRNRASADLMNLLGHALLAGYGREQELQADRLGAAYLARTGYDPRAMLGVLSVLRNQELFDLEQAKRDGRAPRRHHGLFASHPDAETRLREAVSDAAVLGSPTRADHRERFLEAIDGLTFGDSPEQGVVRGASFYHEAFGIAIDFPPDWRIRNLPDRVVAIAPAQAAQIELRLVPDAKGTPGEVLARGIRVAPASVREITIGDMPAATAAHEGRRLRAGVVRAGRHVFALVATAAAPAALARTEAAFESSFASLRRLSPAERRLAQGMRVRLITAAPGITYADLARGSPLGRDAASVLRLLNAQYPAGEPQAGQLLKIVE